MPLSFLDLETDTFQGSDFAIGVRSGRTPREEFKFTRSLDETLSVSTSGNYTVQPDDEHIYVSITGGDAVLSLPALATNQNRILNIYTNAGATGNSLTLEPNASELIAGQGNFVGYGNMNWKLLALSGSWEIVGGYDVQLGTRFIAERTARRHRLLAWDWITGDATDTITEAYTMPISFASIDHVSTSFLGARSVGAGDPTSRMSFTSDVSTVSVLNRVLSITQVSVMLSRVAPSQFATTFNYGYGIEVAGRWR